MAYSKCPQNTAVAAAAVILKKKKKSVNRHEEQSCGFQDGSMDWGLGLADANSCIRWINNKVLLYS